MYRLNPLQRNVLITTDEVIAHAPTMNTLDPRMIEQSIIVAEERLLRPLLGNEYYYSLIDQKNVLITSGNIDDRQDEVNGSLPPESQQVTLEIGQIINAAEYLSSENLALWKQHLWKLTAECVMLMAYPEGFVQFSSQGVIHTNPPAGPLNSGGLVTPELRSVKWAMDKKMMDRIDPLREALHVWVCMQKKTLSTKYPLYLSPCDCDSKGVAYRRKSNIVLGIYDDDHRGRNINPWCCP